MRAPVTKIGDTPQRVAMILTLAKNEYTLANGERACLASDPIIIVTLYIAQGKKTAPGSLVETTTIVYEGKNTHISKTLVLVQPYPLVFGMCFYSVVLKLIDDPKYVAVVHLCY